MNSKLIIFIISILVILLGCLSNPKYSAVVIKDVKDLNDRIELSVRLEVDTSNSDKICGLTVHYPAKYLEFTDPKPINCNPPTSCFYSEKDIDFNNMHTFVFMKKTTINESLKDDSNMIQLFFSGLPTECKFIMSTDEINISSYLG